MSVDGPTIAALGGVWCRRLLSVPGRDADTSTAVLWLQGGRHYGDIRQPPNAPDFSWVRGLRDLSPLHMAWMAEQDGFAGELTAHPDCFEWVREIDLQPVAARRDRGTLAWSGAVLVETGYEIPYVEHWHRAAAGEPHAALSLVAPDDRRGLIVRYGDHVMIARGRAVPLPTGCHLRDHIEAAKDLAAQQDLFDCEIAFGRIEAEGWRIERSTLPFRVGARLTLRIEGPALSLTDVTPDGVPFDRGWSIITREGRIER